MDLKGKQLIRNFEKQEEFGQRQRVKGQEAKGGVPRPS